MFNKFRSRVTEEARTLFSFIKCMLEKKTGAKKQLKRSKSKENNVKKISTVRIKSSFVFSVLFSLIYT